MKEDGLEFVPQLATDASAQTVNTFRRAWREDPPALILRPAFQRNLVWNRKQQSFLIDSILRGMPVPELYVQTTTSADGAERLTVVDGQQRISACLAFIDGQLQLDESVDLDRRWRGKRFDQLDDGLKARFLGFKFVVRDPSTAKESVLREIFRRLNTTVEALEPQELRHAAYTGPFIKLVERAGDAASLADLGVFTPKDFLRRRNDEFVAEVLMAIYAGAFPNKKEGLDDLFLTLERRGFPKERESNLSQRFGRAASWVGAAGATLRRTRFRNKSDCYSLLVFLGKRAEHVSVQARDVEACLATLIKFSELVNAIKREEAQGRSVDALVKGRPRGQSALTYLRAVERAASDRSNRVRRDTALQEILGSVVSRQVADALSARDEVWDLAGEELEEPAVDEEDETGGRSVQETLLSDGGGSA